MQSRWRLRRHNRRERVAQLTGAGTTAAVGGRCSPGQLRDPPAEWEDELWDLFFYGVPHHQRPEPGVLPRAWPSAQCVAGGGCSLSPMLADQHPVPGPEESATPSGGPVAAVSPTRRLFSLPSQSPPKTPTMTSSSSPLAFYPERGGGPHQQSSPLFGGGTTSSLFSAGILSGMGNPPAEGLWVPPKFRESDHIVSRIAEKVDLPLQENAECAKIVWCQDRDDLERFLQQARVSHARQARADKEQVEHRNLVRGRLVNAVGAARAAHLLHQLGAGGGGAAAVFAGGGGDPDHTGPTGGSYPPQSASFLFDREPGDVVYVNRFPQMFHITRKDLLARNLQSLHKHLPDDYNFYPPTYCLSTDSRQLQKYLSLRFSSGVSLLPPGGMFGENGDGTGINATNEENGNENPLGQLQCQGLWFTGLLGGRHSQERARLRLVRKDPSSPLLQAIQAPLTPLNEPPQFLAPSPSPGLRRNSTGGLNLFPGEATTQTLAQAIGGGRETAGGSSPSKWRPDRINARTPEAKSKASRSRRNSTGGGDDEDNAEDDADIKGSSDEDERVESEKDGSGNERERGKRCTFILKPADGSKGNGIRLCQITQDAYRKGTWADDLTKHIQHILGSADATRNLQNERRFLLQRYVTAPSTLECDIKWDARVYVVITSTRPQLQAYLFDEGFARLCTLPYQRPRPHNLQDFGRHLTNFSINWREDNFDDTGEPHTGSKRSLKCVLAQISRLYGMSGTAELFHNDLSKCWLLEVNHDPSLSVLTYVDRVVKGKLVAQIFELIGAVGPDPEAVKDRGRGGGAGGATEVDTVTESDRDETESEERGGRRCRPGTTWVPALLSDASEAEYAQRRELDKKKRKRSNLMKGVAAGGKVTGGEDSDTDWSECGDATSDGHSCNKRRGRRGHSHRGLLTENFLNFHVTANFMHLLPITPEMHGEACCEKAREITAVATKNASKWLEFSAEHLYDHNHEGVVQPAAGT
eukprot:g10080.t1